MAKQLGWRQTERDRHTQIHKKTEIIKTGCALYLSLLVKEMTSAHRALKKEYKKLQTDAIKITEIIEGIRNDVKILLK